MQIQNDYRSFQNRNYQQGHQHHITECLHEEKEIKKEGGLSGVLSGAKSQTSNQNIQTAPREENFVASGISRETASQKGNKKTGLVKGLWDALGEEENMLSGVYAAAASFKTAFAHRIVNKWEYVRERIKTGAFSMLKRFGRGRDAFTALSEEGTPSEEKKAKSKAEKQKGQVSTKRREEEIPMKNLSHSHLMDSYSKTGEYCQINENLTYQKPKAFQEEKEKKEEGTV